MGSGFDDASRRACLRRLASVLRAPADDKLEARSPPPGDVAGEFDRGSLVEVFTHLCAYEALPGECARALRALVALAFADADQAVSLLPQVIRVASLHPAEPRVQALVGRVLANVAYDAEVARRSLCEPEVVEVLLRTLALRPSEEAVAKASEALASIVAAHADPAIPRDTGEPGALHFLYALACREDGRWHIAARDFIQQLVQNEIVDIPTVAESFVVVTSFFQEIESAPLSNDVEAKKAVSWESGWLLLVDSIIADDSKLLRIARALTESGVVPRIADILKNKPSDIGERAGVSAAMQMALSGPAGLEAFADVRGCRFVEAAMGEQLSETGLLVKCIQFFSGCLTWSESLRSRAGFVSGRAVDLIKAAMAANIDCAELQLLSLEVLAYYVEHLHCHRLVKAGGGEGLVKAVMTRHSSDSKIQTWGRCLLDAIGANRFWAPKGGVSADVLPIEEDEPSEEGGASTDQLIMTPT